MVGKVGLMLMLALSLAACETATGGPDPPPNPNPGLEPYLAKGRVVDPQGHPLAGVKIIVDNTVFYNSAVTGTTDAQGSYEIRVGDGSWRVYAEMRREYNGRTYKIDLAPDTFDAFAGMDGAVRNFTWKLTGKKPEPLVGYFGGSILVFGDELYDVENVELTLTPVGPLIDGSAGETVIRWPNGPDVSPPSEAEDIPLGRYEVSAAHLPSGEALLVGSAACDGYAASRTIDFDPEDYDRARICVRLPAEPVPPEELALSGTVYAPYGDEDVAGTFIFACFVVDEDCDEARSRYLQIADSG
jgi:hypothetical protein